MNTAPTPTLRAATEGRKTKVGVIHPFKGRTTRSTSTRYRVVSLSACFALMADLARQCALVFQHSQIRLVPKRNEMKYPVVVGGTQIRTVDSH